MPPLPFSHTATHKCLHWNALIAWPNQPITYFQVNWILLNIECNLFCFTIFFLVYLENWNRMEFVGFFPACIDCAFIVQKFVHSMYGNWKMSCRHFDAEKTIIINMINRNILAFSRQIFCSFILRFAFEMHIFWYFNGDIWLKVSKLSWY